MSQCPGVSKSGGPSQLATDDVELSRRAAAGEQDAFEQLYGRHVQLAWGLAQALAASPEEAAGITAHAFARVVGLVRRGRSAAAQEFDSYLLAAIRMGAGQSQHGSAHPPRRDDQVFRSLPRRWRAALWMTEVDQLPVEAVAFVLGSSVGATSPILDQSRARLNSRVTDLADLPAAPGIDAYLLPAGLAQATLAEWRRVVAAPRHRVADVVGWLPAPARRQVAAGAAGVLALGFIALGVLGARVCSQWLASRQPLERAPGQSYLRGIAHGCAPIGGGQCRSGVDRCDCRDERFEHTGRGVPGSRLRHELNQSVVWPRGSGWDEQNAWKR